MPLYEYRCLKCDETFEVRQKFSDEPIATHPGCGGQAQRLLSTPGLHFKGSGFYITDYGKGGSKSASSPAKSESKPAESKPAAPSTPSTPAKS